MQFHNLPSSVQTPYGIGSVQGFNPETQMLQVLLHKNGAMFLSVHVNNVQFLDEQVRRNCKRAMEEGPDSPRKRTVR